MGFIKHFKDENSIDNEFSLFSKYKNNECVCKCNCKKCNQNLENDKE